MFRRLAVAKSIAFWMATRSSVKPSPLAPNCLMLTIGSASLKYRVGLDPSGITPGFASVSLSVSA